jgi:pilus assembly protein CpaF
VERFAAGAAVARRGRAAAVDFGPIAALVADPRVTDVFVNGAGPVWVDRGRGLERTAFALTESDARDLAVRLVALGGRHVDEANPLVDTRLSDGIRVHAALAPVSPIGTLVSVRLPVPRPPTLTDLERGGFFDLILLADVLPLVRDRVNLLVTGAAGSGKTTLLAALLSRASPSERIVAIEDVAELRVRHPHFVPLEARQANLEGAGSIDLARLLREALRMRPDRLVLGECRGAEVRDLLSALNTGHDGGAGTLHANSLADVPARLEALGALAGMTPATVARQAVSAIGAVLHVERIADGPNAGMRRLAHLGRLTLHDDRLAVEPL